MAIYHVSQLKPNEISANLRSGTFALKWPEEASKPVIPIAVNLSVDIKGFYLICLNKITKESECFDISLIHDTRTGSEASLPRGANECEQVNIGTLDVPLASKWLTIYYGNSFIPERDLRVIHFCFQSPVVTRQWTEELFRYGHNPLLRNLSSLECLEKFHSRIIHGLVDDRFDKKAIPVRNLLQFLCKNSRDANKEIKILRALEYLELPCRAETVIDPDQFTFNKFIQFYMQLMERNEIDKLFEATKAETFVEEGVLAMLPGGKRRRFFEWEKMRDFIMKQNDAIGNAFGMDYYDQKAKDLVKKYAQHEKVMSVESFLCYLLGIDNLIVDPAKFDLFMEMDKPLAHYFISSSHNTYLTGSQLTGRASIEMYRQVLLTGCRCVELDVVDSEKKNDEPEIKHKNTPVRSVSFLQVICAIRDCAFKVSPYPVILSIENHCSPRAQAKMAEYLVDVFGDNLITQPLKTHPIEDNSPLPSPVDLKYKILIKNKKRHHHHPTTKPIDQTLIRKTDSILTTTSELSIGTNPLSISTSQSNDSIQRKQNVLNEIRNNDGQINEIDSPLIIDNQNRTNLINDDEDNSSDDEELLTATTSNDLNLTNPTNILTDQTTNQDYVIESKATKAMSDLVHYIVPVSFTTFADAEIRNRSYEISSFSEDKAQSFIRDYGKEFLAYNQRQLSRIYPRGTRFDSSNYNPYLFWPVGCQMVALNYQTLDTPMQVNLGLFSFNGACGYLEKPASLCQSTSSFDPKGRTNVENVVIYQIDIKLISGQFLCQDREPTYVDIEMYGMYADATKRHEYRLRAKRWNGFQAIYDDTDVESGEFSIRFSKVILPEMAALRFAVSEEDGTFIGQGFIPVAHLRPGYRHIVLRNQMNISVQASSLFVFIRKNVHVDDENRELIDQLVSPKSKQINNKEQQQQQQQQHFKFKPLSAQRSRSFGDFDSLKTDFEQDKTKDTNGKITFSSNVPIHHYPSTTEINIQQTNINKKRNPSTPFVDANWYQTQLIASSQLHDTENLCQTISLKDIQQLKQFRKRQESIENKIRRISTEFDKKIQNEEDHFQKCLYRLNTIMYPSLQRPIVHRIQIESSSQFSDNRTSSLSHQRFITDEMKQAETRLLDLYSTKFHSQNEIEYKLSKEYYNELEKYFIDFYTKQLNNINYILKQEQLKVKGDVRVQMKSETKKTIMSETDRGKINTLKEKIRQISIEAGALAIRKLQDMHEQLEKTIKLNLQTTLNRIQEEKDLENKNRFIKYSNQLNEIKHRLQRDIYGHDYTHINENVPSTHRPTMTTSTSLSSLANHCQNPTNSTTYTNQSSSINSSIRRQTIDSNTSLRNPPTNDELMSYINQTTETTKF